jgi:hypothetical protein
MIDSIEVSGLESEPKPVMLSPKIKTINTQRMAAKIRL